MCRSLAAAYSNALHIPAPWAGATPFSLKAHPLCLQYAKLAHLAIHGLVHGDGGPPLLEESLPQSNSFNGENLVKNT